MKRNELLKRCIEAAERAKLLPDKQKSRIKELQTMNSFCADCRHALNALNGRYCTKLHRYVEYSTAPQCLTNKNQRI
nr:MAG TPA: hypothetical protein [Caudoviricetes sp.]